MFSIWFPPTSLWASSRTLPSIAPPRNCTHRSLKSMPQLSPYTDVKYPKHSHHTCGVGMREGVYASMYSKCKETKGINKGNQVIYARAIHLLSFLASGLPDCKDLRRCLISRHVGKMYFLWRRTKMAERETKREREKCLKTSRERGSMYVCMYVWVVTNLCCMRVMLENCTYTIRRWQKLSCFSNLDGEWQVTRSWQEEVFLLLHCLKVPGGIYFSLFMVDNPQGLSMLELP